MDITICVSILISVISGTGAIIANTRWKTAQLEARQELMLRHFDSVDSKLDQLLSEPYRR